MRKVKNIIYYIVIVILCIIFLYSLKNIIAWLSDNKKTKKVTETIQENTEIKEVKVTEDQDIDLLIDASLEDLKNINKDTVGYIRVLGTKIDYPIVKTTDNEFYLTHSFDKTYNKAGWVFMDYRNNLSLFDDNTILYAHGRLDNTMFGSLRSVVKSEWYENSDNYYVYYFNDYYTSKWKVFSTYKVKETSDYLTINFDNQKSKQDFIDIIKNRSVYDYNTEVKTTDKVITLSSCYDDNYRVVLHAKLEKYVKK